MDSIEHIIEGNLEDEYIVSKQQTGVTADEFMKITTIILQLIPRINNEINILQHENNLKNSPYYKSVLNVNKTFGKLK